MIILYSLIIFAVNYRYSMTIKERVQGRLKPKVKQFGFSKKVFKSIAAKIADKLEDLDESASEDDINAKIDEVIEDHLPYLALVQSSANEQLEEWKKAQQKDEIDEEEDDDDDSDSNRNNRHTKSNRTKPADKGTSAQSKEMKELMDAVKALTNEVSSLKAGKTADTRRSKLEALLKDSGVFGKRTLKNFAKMNFDDEDDFEEYLSEVEDDLKAYNQERADAGLSSMGNPPGGKGDKQERKEEVFSDEEIDSLAD